MNVSRLSRLFVGVLFLAGLVWPEWSRGQTRPMGTDVSSYQGSGLNWTTVKNDGVFFAWTKATEGTYYIDADFTINESHAQSAGVYIGAYHFARPSDDPNITGSKSADTEAQYFWATAGPYVVAGGGYLVPMLDWEDPYVTNVPSLTTSVMSQWVNEWCNDVSNYARANGVTIQPVVYTGTWYSEPGTYPGLNSTVTTWPSWLAAYPYCTQVGSDLECGSPTPQTSTPGNTYPWSTWNIWQYGDTNWSGGDSDVFNGTSNQFLQLFLVGGTNVSTQSTLYWDPAGLKGSQGSGGSGSWDGSTTDWWLSGSSDLNWPAAGANAVFAGAAGTVTLAASESASSLAVSTNGYTIAGSATLTLNSPGTITIPGGSTASINCVLGGVAYTLQGGGALILNNSGNYSDGETVIGPNTTLEVVSDHDAGNDGVTLNLQNGGIYQVNDTTNNDQFLLPQCAVALLAGGGVFNNPNASLTMTNWITGGGSLTYTGGSGKTLTLTDTANNYSGGTVVAGPGTLQANAAGTLGSTAGTLTVSGGTLNLNGASHTVGAVTIAGGTIQNGTLTGSSYAGQSGTVSAVLAGSAALTKTTTNTLTLSGANTYTGITSITGGQLNISADNNLGAAPTSPVANKLTFNSNAVLRVQTSSFTLSANRGITLLSGGGSLQIASGITTTYPGVITGAGGLMIGTSITVGEGTLILSGANNYAGATTIACGTLQLGANGTLPAGTPLTIESADVGGTLNLNGFSQTIGPLASGPGFGGNGTQTPGIKLTGALAIVESNDTTFAGVISGSGGSLTITGPGTLTLTAANTYTGNTSINAGTLALGSLASINSTGQISIAAGATLDVSALSSFTLGSSTTLNASGTGSPATIKGGSSVSLGAQPIILNYDGTHPALTISQGVLSLNGNAFTVNGAPLPAGYYTLIQQGSGDISGSGIYSVSGSAIGVGMTPSVAVSGGNVILTLLPPNSRPVTITNITMLGNGAVQMNFSGVSYYTYLIQATTNLAPPVAWSTIGTNTADSNGLFNFTDSNAIDFPARFYRTKVQ